MLLMEYSAAFISGSLIYGITETLFRGQAHWTMWLTGGACFLVFHAIVRCFPKLTLPFKCLISCAVITGIEFAVGCVVNLWLGMRVWSYAAHPMNFMGQVCPLFSSVWFFFGIPMSGFSGLFSRIFKRMKTAALASKKPAAGENP